jgi:hypothetical protein
MKINVVFSSTISLLTFLAISLSMNAQDILNLNFQNLDFEQANPGTLIPTDPPSAPNVPVGNALPYWSVYYGAVEQTEINYNAPGTGSTLVTLVGGAWPTTIDNYSVLLQGGFTASAASISQSGTIPAGMQSILFEAHAGSGTLDVIVGTQIVPFAAVGSGPNYTLYGADISEWAGDPEQITFSALQDLSVANNWTIDDISFSPNAVPEPSIVALSAMGGLLFGARKCLRFARRQ